MKDYTLSPVFNIRGSVTSNDFSFDESDSVYSANGFRQYIPIDKYKFTINQMDNCKGVVQLKAKQAQILNNGSVKGVFPIGLKMKAYDEANLLKELKKLTIGYFFVRQKRIMTTLCQAVTMGIEVVSHLPTLPIKGGKYLLERFLTKDRILSHSFRDRCVELANTTVNPATAALCPEYEMRYSYFN